MTDDLKRFIETFENEDALRRAVEALLMKMPGCKNVRATHGTLEHGKDIVFRSEGPMGESTLNACVIKVDKITGSADSSSGARTVFHQVEQSLDTPILNEQGESQSVARAYVITPNECSLQAMESIKGKLEERSGQVVFICGNELLGKFKRYWPDFLLSNLTFLGAHIKSLRDELEEDASVSRLLFKEGFSGAHGKTTGQLYVRPRFACTLRAHALKLHLPDPKEFERPMRENGASRLANVFRHLGHLILSIETTPGAEAQATADEMFKLATGLPEAWVSAFNVYRTRADLTELQRRQPKDQTSISVGGAELFRDRSEKLLKRAAPFLTKLREYMDAANAISSTKIKDPVRLLDSNQMPLYNTVSDICRRVPSVVVAAHSGNKIPFDSNLLDLTSAPVLITGPAGYGKTSFCKWHVLRDLESLERRTSMVLPVYIQLHKLPEGPITSFRDAFLSSEELEIIWREISDSKTSSKWLLRLYLDGLDEVASTNRQMEIAEAAKTGALNEHIQIIVTARDHVSGPWLSWLRRLDLQPFNEPEVRQLVSQWLDDDLLQVSTFYEKLLHVPSLASLMKVPLLATLILAVYKHGHESLPESRPRLYEMFVRLLAGGWDAAKNVNRGSQFGSPTKTAILSHLAGVLHTERRRDCSSYDVKAAVRERVHGLQDRWEELTSELIADGLLVPTGSILSFPHLSFQEFLAAKDLVQLRPDRANQRLDTFLQGDDWWREVVTFYVSFQDKPSEIEEWIRAGVVRTLSRSSDDVIRSRAIELCGVVLTNFAGFRFTRETRDVLNWYSESAFDVAKQKVSSGRGNLAH